MDSTKLLGMISLLALGNGYRIVATLRGGLLRKAYVFDQETHGFYVNGTLVAKFSQILWVAVQGRWESTGIFRTRVALTLVRGEMFIIAETPLLAWLPYYMSHAYTSIKIKESGISGDWTKIDTDCPLLDVASAEMFALEETIADFLRKMQD